MNQEYEELNQLFSEAESCIKNFELEDFNTPYSPVNELRYAGRHLISYLVKSDPREFEHCKCHIERSMSDALEMYIVVYLEKIRGFEESYRKTSFTSCISDWVSIKKRLNEISINLSIPVDSKNKKISVLKDEGNFLKSTWDLLDASHEELNKQLNKDRWVKIGVIGTIVAIFVAIIAVICG